MVLNHLLGQLAPANKIKMKRQKNIPVMHEVLSRQNEYQTHLWKLQQIQLQRRKNLARKSLIEKTVMIEHIKNQKHSNFIQKLSKESSRINQENLRLVDKLNRATVSVSSHSHRPPALSLTSLSYTVKRTREKEIAKENSRIFHKLNNSCPFVNTHKITEEYQRNRKIGDRLRKYDDSCELKTKKYIKTSSLSTGHRAVATAPTSPNKGCQPRAGKMAKPRIANFYNRDDILKNKIEHRGVPSAKVLLRTLQARQMPEEKHYYDFFNTQVHPNNPENHI